MRASQLPLRFTYKKVRVEFSKTIKSNGHASFWKQGYLTA